MSSNETIKDRETKKIMMIEHVAFATVVNDIDPKCYKYFSANNGNLAMEELIRVYRLLLEQCERAFAQTEEQVSFIDKAACFAMAMKRRPLFHLGKEAKKYAKLKNANEKSMVEGLLLYLCCSEYKIYDHHKKIIMRDNFGYEGFGEGRKKEFANLKKSLLEECSKPVIDFTSLVELLNNIYLKGVMYKEDIDYELEDKVKKRLVASELYKVPNKRVEINPEYTLHKSKYRSMK